MKKRRTSLPKGINSTHELKDLVPWEEAFTDSSGKFRRKSKQGNIDFTLFVCAKTGDKIAILQKNFDPEHPLARDSKGRSLALPLYSCLIKFVSCRPPLHYVSRTHCRSPAVPHARALACMSVMVEVVKGAKFLHEVH